MGRHGGLPALRRGLFGLLRLGERRLHRLQRGEPDPRRVPHHGGNHGRPQHPRGAGHPLERRQLPRGPGLLADQRDGPRSLAPRPAPHLRARLLGERRPRDRLPRRHSGLQRERREPGARSGGSPRSALRTLRPGRQLPLGRPRGAAARRAPRRRGLHGGHRDHPRRPRLVGRDPEPLPAGPDARRRRRGGDRSHRDPGGLPAGRDGGRRTAPEWPSHRPPGREPARARPRAGPRGGRGGDARGHPAHEAPQHQRSADGALPEPAPLLRVDRRVRPLRGGRAEHRVARDGLPARGDPRRASRVAGRAPRPDRADGHPGPEPPVGDHLVARQRGRRRRELRRHLGVDPGERPLAADPLRAGRRAGRRGHRGSHVRPSLLARALRRLPVGKTLPARRVRARHGEQRGEPGRLLGGDRQRSEARRRVHLGLGGPGDPPRRRLRPAVLGLRGRHRAAGDPHRRQLPGERTGVGRPETPPARFRGQEGVPAPPDPGAPRPLGADRGRESPRLHRSLRPRGKLATDRRRGGARRGGAASDLHPAGREPRSSPSTSRRPRSSRSWSAC